MILAVTRQGGLMLEESDDFRRFHIRDGGVGGAGLLDVEAFAEIARPADEAGHYWLDADAVIALSGHSAGDGWVQQFWDMLAKVERFGYADLAARRIKGHIQ